MGFFSKIKDKFKGSIVGSVLGGPVGLMLGSSYDKQRADNIAQNKMIEKQNDLNMYSWNLQNNYNLPKNQMQRYLDAGLNPNLIYGSISNGNASSGPELSASVPGNSTSALAGVLNQAGTLGTKIATSLFMKGAELDLEQKEANLDLTKANTKKVLGSVDNQGNKGSSSRLVDTLKSSFEYGKEIAGNLNDWYRSLPIEMGSAERKINSKMINDLQNGKISYNQYKGFITRQYNNTGDEQYLRVLGALDRYEKRRK